MGRLGPVTKVSDAIGDHTRETIAQAMCWTWIQRTRTAADGTFDFRMLTVPTMEMKARFQEGKRGTEEFRLVPGDELLTLTIR